MGRPVDRSPGVVLVTDYGALDRALAQKARQKAEEIEKIKSLMKKCLFKNQKTEKN